VGDNSRRSQNMNGLGAWRKIELENGRED